jgi:hypothetical protein
VFGPYDSFMGYGIVGGRVVSWEQLGREAAALALRISKGESPGSIPFRGEQAYIDLYDWRELRRWNITESAVPRGSEILINVIFPRNHVCPPPKKTSSSRRRIDR